MPIQFRCGGKKDYLPQANRYPLVHFYCLGNSNTSAGTFSYKTLRHLAQDFEETRYI